MKKAEINMERLALAIAEHDKAVADTQSHKAELASAQSQVIELDDEITKLSTQLKDFDLNKSTVIADIRAFAQNKSKAQFEIDALTKVRDELKARCPKMERDYSYMDVVSVGETKRHCWGVLYDGLLKSIDTEPLKQLLAVGVATGLHERMVMSDLNLSVEYERLDALAKQFNLPV